MSIHIHISIYIYICIHKTRKCQVRWMSNDPWNWEELDWKKSPTIMDTSWGES